MPEVVALDRATRLLMRATTARWPCVAGRPPVGTSGVWPASRSGAALSSGRSPM